MSKLSSAYDIYSSEGFMQLIRTIKSVYLPEWRSAIPVWIYQLYYPNSITLTIDNYSAEFDTDILSPGRRPDFRRVFYTEKPAIRWLLNNLSNDDIFYDIGANIGIYSSFAGQVITRGKIIAFEPNSTSIMTLDSNLSTNCKSASIVQVAGSNESKFTMIDTEKFTKASMNSESGVNVKAERVEDIVNSEGIAPPTVMKIDVEGAEVEVIHGLGNLIEHVECLLVEYHPRRIEQFDGNEEELVNILERNFDEVIKVSDAEGKPYFKSVK